MSGIIDNAVPTPRAPKKVTFSKLFDEADQDRIRGDLSIFFGPRADTFLDTYEKMRAATGTRRNTPRTWCWPVFLGSFTWFFYRKMYAYGAMLIFLPLIFSYLLGSSSGVMSILFAIWAKGYYVNYALQRIFKADQLGLTGPERIDYLQRAGGVSVPAGLFAGFIYACMLAAVISVIVVGPHAGHHK
jgi:hypothetical protein